jgi:hypothetical protein
MKSWAIAGATVALMAMMACSSNGTSGSTVTTTVASGTGATSTSSAGTGGTGATDPVCMGTTPSSACVGCVNNLGQSEQCLATFSASCKADAQCLAYARCLDGCLTSNMTGVGGGSTACLAQGSGGQGGAGTMCETCCIDGNNAGANTYATDLVNDCVCASGAPCAMACAQ